MKKLYLLLLVAILTFSITTGCSNNGENNEGTNTSTGTNDQAENTNPQNPCVDLAQNVSSSGTMTQEGKLVVLVKNNNNVE